MQTLQQPKGDIRSFLHIAHQSRVTADELDIFDDEPPVPPATFHTLKRQLTQEEAEERFELEMVRESQWMDSIADRQGWAA